MSTLAVAYAVMMAVLGWYVAWRYSFDPAVTVMCALASLGLVVAIIGWVRRQLMLAGGGMVACAVLFPTGYGMLMIIIGGVIFMLMVGLRLFEMIEGEDK